MIKSKTNRPVGKAILLLWACLCIIVFVNYPGKVSFLYWAKFDNWLLLGTAVSRIEPLTYLINLLRALVGVSLFSLGCICTGILAMKPLKLKASIDRSSLLQHAAVIGTAFLIGHGIFSLIFLTLSSVYRLTPAIILTVGATGTISGLKYLKNYIFTANINHDWLKTFDSPMWKIVFGLSIAIPLVTMLYSSARLSYDSVAVYFSDAKLTAMTNHIKFFTNDSFVVSTFQTAIQYVALIQLFGDQSARLFTWVTGLTIVVFSIALGERVGLSKKGLLVLLSILVTSTAFIDLMGDGKVDLMSTALALATIYWIVANSQGVPHKNTRPGFVIIGFLLGLALVTRPFNIFLLGIFISLFYLKEALLDRSTKTINYDLLKTASLWIGTIAMGLAIYYFLENKIILGNALAIISNTTKATSSNWQWAYDPNSLIIIRLLYPFTATFINSPQSLGNISPLFVAFLPMTLNASLRRKINISSELKILFAISVTTLALWIIFLFTVFEIRYVLFLWIIIFMPLAEIIASVLRKEDHLYQITLSGLMIVLLLFIFLRTIFVAFETYAPIDKYGNPQCYDERFCALLGPVNKSASNGARILTLTAFRYYLRSDLFACSTTNKEYAILREYSINDAEAFWEEIYRQGYKYITYENDYTTRHLQFGLIPSPANTPNWITLEPIYGKPGDLYISYRIHASNPPIEINKTCHKNQSGIWEVQGIK